jgi:hypothetical protein
VVDLCQEGVKVADVAMTSDLWPSASVLGLLTFLTLGLPRMLDHVFNHEQRSTHRHFLLANGHGIIVLGGEIG